MHTLGLFFSSYASGVSLLHQFCGIFRLHLLFNILICSYATVYTMAPVFSLVLDEDVSDEIALRYPELYKDLVKVI